MISSTLFFKAAFLAIGDIDEVENGVLAHRSEFGELGGFNRTAILAGDQLQFGDAALAKCVADPRRLRLARGVEVALDRAVLEIHVVGFGLAAGRIGVPQQDDVARFSEQRPDVVGCERVGGRTGEEDDQTPETETHNRFRKRHCRNPWSECQNGS